MPTSTPITVETTANISLEQAWSHWTTPEHIMQWNNADDDWHTPRAEIDLREGGRFLYRMEAKDGSVGFDFNGIFTKVIPLQSIEYTIEGGRKVSVTFSSQGEATTITETFEIEDENPVEMQRQGWQAILNNFKKYTEAHR